MAFKTQKKDTINFDTPQEMYSDYKNRTINGLINYQSEMIDNYMKSAYNESDVALELPTGSGKTLIGLVIGEYRRRKDNEKIVYLCPNKQLVNQVVEQANSKYGIKANGFTGRQADYDPMKVTEYQRGKVIAVTTYSGLFNSNPVFNDADILILDDAHSCENYIASNWSLEISRYEHQALFKNLTEHLKETIGISNYNRMTSSYSLPDELYWCDLIPIPKILDKIIDLISIIDAYISDINPSNSTNSDKNIKYTWPNIRNHLKSCNIFINWDTILIRPFIPPTKTIPAFFNPKQRIYMSATLGISGELERITGVPKISRLPMVNSWDKKGLGRRFFIFPKASFDNKKTEELIIEMSNVFDRTLILTKDDKRVMKLSDFYKDNTNCNIFFSKDIEQTKETFINSKNSVAILANRYDGIDLSNDECRLLIIDSLPSSTHLQEKFLSTRMVTSILFNERIKTRLVQAVGRCTRSPIDYSVVCILNQNVINELTSKNKCSNFHPELQAEVEFGYEQYEQYKKVSDVIENITIFINHDDEWAGVDKSIIDTRDDIIRAENNTESNKIYSALLSAAKYEVDYQYAIWRDDHEKAIECIEKIISLLNARELRGYRGFWYYLGGCSCYNLYTQGNKSFYEIAKKYMRNASACSDSITWFRNLIEKSDVAADSSEVDDYVLDVIDNIEVQIQKYGTNSNNKFDKEASNILKLLTSANGSQFEEGHKDLGEFIGYISNNSTEDSSPDPWWIINDNICIVAEDKIYEKSTKPIPTQHVRQATSHHLWINKNVSLLNPNANITTVFITNSEYIEHSATTFAENVYYINRTDFYNWALKAIEGIRKLRRIFVHNGDLVWRAEAIKILREEKLTPLDFLSLIKSKKLNELPTN